jgi:serine/threonine protein phosphatase PrpC
LGLVTEPNPSSNQPTGRFAAQTAPVARQTPNEVDAAVLLGRDHPAYGEIAVRSVGEHLAVATTAGVGSTKAPFPDPNEDAAAVVRGARADLLVVADAHHGGLAARIAVERVISALGTDPPPADLADHELEALVYELGHAIGDANATHAVHAPANMTTLAFALVAPGAVQWASFGDSLVVIGARDAIRSVATPRATYLGSGFVRAEISSLLERDVCRRRHDDYVVLATDGVDAAPGADPEELIREAVGPQNDAAACAHAILAQTLAGGGADAASVAVAVPRRERP